MHSSQIVFKNFDPIFHNSLFSKHGLVAAFVFCILRVLFKVVKPVFNDIFTYHLSTIIQLLL